MKFHSKHWWGEKYVMRMFFYYKNTTIMTFDETFGDILLFS